MQVFIKMYVLLLFDEWLIDDHESNDPNLRKWHIENCQHPHNKIVKTSKPSLYPEILKNIF